MKFNTLLLSLILLISGCSYLSSADNDCNDNVEQEYLIQGPSASALITNIPPEIDPSTINVTFKCYFYKYSCEQGKESQGYIFGPSITKLSTQNTASIDFFGSGGAVMSTLRHANEYIKLEMVIRAKTNSGSFSGEGRTELFYDYTGDGTTTVRPEFDQITIILY